MPRPPHTNNSKSDVGRVHENARLVLDMGWGTPYSERIQTVGVPSVIKSF